MSKSYLQHLISTVMNVQQPAYLRTNAIKLK